MLALYETPTSEITLHLSGWNAIFQFVSQFDSLSRSCCSVSASLFDFIARYAMVSSANRRVVDGKPGGMSLI
jgi:hypothetical protein